MSKILDKAREIIKLNFSSNKAERNTKEIKPNKVRRNKWGFPVFSPKNKNKNTKKIR